MAMRRFFCPPQYGMSFEISFLGSGIQKPVGGGERKQIQREYVHGGPRTMGGGLIKGPVLHCGEMEHPSI